LCLCLSPWQCSGLHPSLPNKSQRIIATIVRESLTMVWFGVVREIAGHSSDSYLGNDLESFFGFGVGS
jgi:hypothetical protein